MYQPDFDYRVMEPYRPSDVGQTEMLIMKVRRELALKAKLINDPLKLPLPSPSKALTIDTDPSVLSTKDASRLLGVSNMTIVRLADDGTLPCFKTPKGHRRFKRGDIQKLLDRNHLSPTPLTATKPLIGVA